MEKEILYCTTAFTYDGKWRSVGESILVRKNHAKVLLALNRVSRESPNVVPLFRSEDVAPISVEAFQGIVSDVKGEETTAGDEEAVKQALRAEYKSLFGKDAHGRTSVEKLRADIERKKAE